MPRPVPRHDDPVSRMLAAQAASGGGYGVPDIGSTSMELVLELCIDTTTVAG